MDDEAGSQAALRHMHRDVRRTVRESGAHELGNDDWHRVGCGETCRAKWTELDSCAHCLNGRNGRCNVRAGKALDERLNSELKFQHPPNLRRIPANRNQRAPMTLWRS